jgi:hypothetical protein
MTTLLLQKASLQDGSTELCCTLCYRRTPPVGGGTEGTIGKLDKAVVIAKEHHVSRPTASRNTLLQAIDAAKTTDNTRVQELTPIHAAYCFSLVTFKPVPVFGFGLMLQLKPRNSKLIRLLRGSSN